MILFVWLVAGYLVGSTPTAYLVARAAKGIDIRQYGSGNAGGANVVKHVGLVAGVVVALVDAAKALIPVLLAFRLNGPAAGTAAALGAIAGHCWSLYLGFSGGRGMACTAAALLAVFPPGAAYLVLVHVAGSVLFKRAALADIVGLLTLIPIAIVTRGFGPTCWLMVGALLLVVAKRLEANRSPLPEDRAMRRQVIWLRLLYDRDVPPGVAWTDRTPTA